MSIPTRPMLVATVLCAVTSHGAAQSSAGTPSPEPAVAQLPALTITAPRTPDHSTLTQPDLPQARRELHRTPGGAGVVEADRYQQGKVSTLSDSLGMATGVFVQPRFGAEEARLSIRGSGLQRTFHGRGLKLMQDGVPLNLADGSFDFQAVEALSARHVEVWRGANALRYGAATLGGAINFVSPTGYTAEPARLRLEGGSFGYARSHASTGHVAGAWDLYASASTFSQQGFRDHADQATQRASANLGWQLSPELASRFYLTHVHSRSELPGSLTLQQLRQDARQAAPVNILQDQRRDMDWTRVANRTVWRRGSTQAELFLFASSKRLHHPIFQVIDQDSEDRGVEVRVVNEAALAGRTNRFTLGLSAQGGRIQDERHANVNGARGAYLNAFDQIAHQWEMYAENDHRIAEDLSLIVGLQALQARRRSVDQLVTDVGDEGFDVRYRALNPKIGLLHQLSPKVQLFANVSRSAEPPSFGELTGGPTPTLNRAQRGTTVEVGSRGQLRGDGGWRLEWDITWYDAHLRNELLGVSTAPGVTTTINAPKSRHQGLELGMEGRIRRLEWRAQALANDFSLRGHTLYGSNTLPGLPDLSARAELGWRLAHGSGKGTLVAVTLQTASSHFIDYANTLRNPGYTIWGLKAAGEITPALTWFLEGRNLADKAYAATTGIVKDAGGPDQAQFLPGDGRSFFAGIDWRFQP